MPSLEETAKRFGIDPIKVPDRQKLTEAVIQARAGGDVPKEIALVAPEPPAAPADPPPAAPPPPPAGNNQQARAMNQAHSVVYGAPVIDPTHMSNLMESQRSLSKTESYIAKENESRVEQLKEEAERQHEKEMLAMKQQGRDRESSLIDRLGKESSRGGSLRVWDPASKSWKYGNKLQVGRGGARLT
jgi:hypothetical protein